MSEYINKLTDSFDAVITCQSGLEPIVARELKDLGYSDPTQGRRHVTCRLNYRDMILLNMSLRTAINILVPVKSFKATDYDMLYFRAKKIHWHKIFGPEHTYRIDIKGRSGIFKNSQFTIHRIKDAISDTFRKFYHGKRPSIDKREPDIHIVVHVQEEKVSVSLDSSGIPLFKRGYREQHGEAPLKEDLAAALLYFMEWDRKTPVLDPMCGTGTILVEAYLMARNIPPNLFRTFAFMNWKNFNTNLYNEVRNQLMARIKPLQGVICRGIEKDKNVFHLATNIVDGMDASDFIHIENNDFRNVKGNFNGHILISNPPYGERLEDSDKVVQLYRHLNRFIAGTGPFNGIGILSSNQNAVTKSKLPVKLIYPLFNGPIKVNFSVF